MMYDVFVSCPKGIEYLLEAEVKALGLTVKRVSVQGVEGSASLEVLYRLSLWSRLANRIQLILLKGRVDSETAIAHLCQDFAWERVFSVDKTFAVLFHGTNPIIRNTMFGAQCIKDGIVDYFRRTVGQRPSVDKTAPMIVIHAYLKNQQLVVSLELGGGNLQQRGYRVRGGEAPIKENLAAALLMRMDWPARAARGESYQDPFCGSGTLVIEAAWMAANIAPGLCREQSGWTHWIDHQAPLWESICEEARAAQRAVTVQIVGSDVDIAQIQLARKNAARAGVLELVRFEKKTISDTRPVAPTGLLLCNPPYGERLGEQAAVSGLYQQLGEVLRAYYADWDAGVLTTQVALAKAIGLRSHKQYAFFNGALACQLYLFHGGMLATHKVEATTCPGRSPATAPVLEGGGLMVLNRLKKNIAHLSKWAKRRQISAYRLYDADLPEYAFAVDCYAEWVVVQEYLPPKTILPAVAEKRRTEMKAALIQALALQPHQIIWKERQQQKGIAQYEKLGRRKDKKSIEEGLAKVLVNLYDYLDTGLFLDHRPLRLQFATLSPGCRFLNLFCYTAVASLHAALAGAKTTNVDLSNTYLRWAEENFQHNGLSADQHVFVQADVKQWLKQAKPAYDVIFLDPPTFSNSKRMASILDVQADHEALIEDAMQLLAPGGKLYFSTHLRRFVLAAGLRERYQVTDITAKTIDEDFKRQAHVHWCYVVARPA